MLKQAFHRIFPTRIIPKAKCASTYSNPQDNYQEVRIPVPWGHLAGKWWGPTDKRPILTFHGWQNNCGSFDLLIPLLPKHLSFLALDFPGHGLSSRLPLGQFYNTMDRIILIRRLQNFFQWERLSLMAHSLGSIECFGFGGFFPNSVEFCICIDGLQVLINAKRLDRVIQSIDEFLKFDAQAASKNEPPCYNMESMVEILYKASRGSIDEDKCKYILARNVKESRTQPGLFYFDRDPRLKAGPLMNWDLEDVYDHARRVNFPLFISRAEIAFTKGYDVIYKQVKEILVKKPNLEFHDVKGTHHGHLNTPELFVDIISNFIEKYDRGNKSIDKKIFENIKY